MSNLGYIVGSFRSKSPFILEDAIRILMPEKERWIEGKTLGELKKMGSTRWIIENDLEGKISKSIQVRMNYALILVDDCVVYETIHCVKSQCWRLSQNLHWRLRGEPESLRTWSCDLRGEETVEILLYKPRGVTTINFVLKFDALELWEYDHLKTDIYHDVGGVTCMELWEYDHLKTDIYIYYVGALRWIV